MTGKPRLRIIVGDAQKWAYYGGVELDGLVVSFAYDIQPGDLDVDGVSIPKNALKLNGASIVGANGTPAQLEYPIEFREPNIHRVGLPPDHNPVYDRSGRASSKVDDLSVTENTRPTLWGNVGRYQAPLDHNGDLLTYALSGAAADSFNFNTVNSQLTFKEAPDYETKDRYSVTVSVSDGALTATATVTVTPVNDAPELSGLANVQYAEGGTDLVAAYTISDPDIGDEHAFFLERG